MDNPSVAQLTVTRVWALGRTSSYIARRTPLSPTMWTRCRPTKGPTRTCRIPRGPVGPLRGNIGEPLRSARRLSDRKSPRVRFPRPINQCLLAAEASISRAHSSLGMLIFLDRMPFQRHLLNSSRLEFPSASEGSDVVNLLYPVEFNVGRQ